MDYIHLSSDIINSFVSVQSKTAPEGFFFVHASFLYLGSFMYIYILIAFVSVWEGTEVQLLLFGPKCQFVTKLWQNKRKIYLQSAAVLLLLIMAWVMHTPWPQGLKENNEWAQCSSFKLVIFLCKC